MLHIPCQLLRRLSCAAGSTFEVSVAPSVSAFHTPISLSLHVDTPSGLQTLRHLAWEAPDAGCVNTRCRLVQLQHAEAVWLHLLPALHVPHGKQVPNQKNSALHLHIIHDEACIIIPEHRGAAVKTSTWQRLLLSRTYPSILTRPASATMRSYSSALVTNVS